MVLPIRHDGLVATVVMATAGKGMPPKTLRGFKRRDPFPKPIRKFDESDLSEMQSGSGSESPADPERAVSLPRTVPTHLLMISVLEQLCMMYERDEAKARQLFKLLCQHLVSMRVVSPLTSLDELSGMRAQYRYHVHKMIVAASSTLHKSRPALPAPMKTLAELSAGLSPLVNGLSPELPFVSLEDVVRSHTSRYRQEFVELDQLGRGGFGSVFRAQNKLDGRQYAVKKIKFRHANPSVLMKVLREVKALANLQHPNIIGYNGAWLEYEKPTFNSFNCLTKLVAEDSKSSIVSKTGATFEDSDIVFEEDDVHEVVDFQVNSYGFGPHDDVSFGSDVFSKSTNCIKEVSKSSLCNEIQNNPLIIPSTALKEDSDCSVNNSSVFSKIPKVSSESALNCHEAEISENLFNLSVSGRSEKVVTKRHCMEKTHNSAEQRLAKSRDAIWRRSLSADPIASREKVVLGDSPADLTNYSDDNFLLEMTVTLFIQMELCSHTLQEWLAERNTREGSKKESVINVGENMKIFQQLVRGVHYIHSQGVLHRDLKPRNIFLNASDLHLKIGDFGLARENVGGDLTETILSPPADLKAHMFWEDHTFGVGTSTYAAPEQLARSLYDNKCDMYSLGVILYEMFEQFSTEMERHEKLKVLRDGNLPEEFVSKWPEQAKTIMLLTSTDPSMRPSARELLDSELFMSKAQVIRDLRRTVKEQEMEIEHLRRLLQERDDEISWLKQNF